MQKLSTPIFTPEAKFPVHEEKYFRVRRSGLRIGLIWETWVLFNNTCLFTGEVEDDLCSS